MRIGDEKWEENGGQVKKEPAAFFSSLGLSGYLYYINFYQALGLVATKPKFCEAYLRNDGRYGNERAPLTRSQSTSFTQ